MFTLRGIPVFVNPMYFLLLLMFGYRHPLQGLMWAVCITTGLIVHEFGHALVARRLRHDPTVVLNGWGGLTTRSRTGNDVEEATIVAMGPAAGLALGLLVFGVWQLLMGFQLATRFTLEVVHMLLVVCNIWSMFNLLPVWPLDGGQLLKLATGRLLSPTLAARVTHGVSLLLIAGLLWFAAQQQSLFGLMIAIMLGVQNVQALQGRSTEAPVKRASSLAVELVNNARDALARSDYREAARLSHQARAQDGVTPQLMERVWETLGIATLRAGEPEEALAYLRRARPTEAVRTATQTTLEQLGRSQEWAQFQTRWANVSSAPSLRWWLVGTLAFIVIAITLVFTTSAFELSW
jgi:Zn-dependent protease